MVKPAAELSRKLSNTAGPPTTIPPPTLTRAASQPQFSISSFLTKLQPNRPISPLHLSAVDKTHTADNNNDDDRRTKGSFLKRKIEAADIIDLTEEEEPLKEKKKKPKRLVASEKSSSKLRTEEKRKQTAFDRDGLWTEQYAPSKKEDLGIHPRKIQDVINWLLEAYNPKLAKYRRLLVLSGPSGCGKTATLRTLAKEEAIEMLEYRNPSNLLFADDSDRQSMLSHFTNFLTRAGMAPALDFGPDPYVPIASTSATASSASPSQKRLILLEDLPNTSHYPTKLALRSALQQYLASPRVTCPLVIIISEALTRPGISTEQEHTDFSNRRGDSVDARSVCGTEVMFSPGCREIAFNPIAPTIMKKALNRTLDQIYDYRPLQNDEDDKNNTKNSSNADEDNLAVVKDVFQACLRPSPYTLDLVIANSNGDIRSALMTLQFLSKSKNLVTATSLAGGLTKKGKKRQKKSARETSPEGPQEMEVKKLLQHVTARESSLFIFHALGKVLYSKRWGEDEEDDRKDTGRSGIHPFRQLDRLPTQSLRKAFSRKPSKVNPDALFAEAPVNSDVFVSYLHHNFTSFTNNIDQCWGIVDHLSMSDGLMRLEGEDWLQRAPVTSQYSFNVAVRGTMMYLPSPVPRRKQVLRKSALWEHLREQTANEDGIHELYTRRDSLAISGEDDNDATTISTDSDGTHPSISLEQPPSLRTIACQRSRRSLKTDIVPYYGLIRPSGTKGAIPFLSLLATYPPVRKSISDVEHMVPGDALDEKEVIEEADETTSQQSGRNTSFEAENELENRPEDELLYDPDDDIGSFDN